MKRLYEKRVWEKGYKIWSFPKNATNVVICLPLFWWCILFIYNVYEYNKIHGILGPPRIACIPTRLNKKKDSDKTIRVHQQIQSNLFFVIVATFQLIAEAMLNDKKRSAFSLPYHQSFTSMDFGSRDNPFMVRSWSTMSDCCLPARLDHKIVVVKWVACSSQPV